MRLVFDAKPGPAINATMVDLGNRFRLIVNELAVVKPAALVCLGATAGQQLLGSHIRIGKDRGRPIESDLAELVTVTTHPSAILRAEDEDREDAMAQFVDDLKHVSQWLAAR